MRTQVRRDAGNKRGLVTRVYVFNRAFCYVSLYGVELGKAFPRMEEVTCSKIVKRKKKRQQ